MLDDADRLGGLFVAAGFVDVDVRELDVPLRTPSLDAFWQRASALAGPVSGIIAGLAVEDRTALVDRATVRGRTLPVVDRRRASRRRAVAHRSAHVVE